MSSKRKVLREETELKSQDLQGFVAEFQNESDRATAILGAALLDEKLRQLLTAFLVDDNVQVALLLDVEQPIGSFGARIRLAYCLGLVARSLFGVLTTIKAIRNAFAHQLHGLSFDSPNIARDCEKLRTSGGEPDDHLFTRRNVFLRATLSAQMELWAMTTSIEAAQRRCKIPEWKVLFNQGNKQDQ